MSTVEKRLVIVGNLGEVQAYRIEAHPRKNTGRETEEKIVYALEEIDGADIVEARKRIGEIVSDAMGRFGHETLDEHELEKEEKHRIVKTVAELVDMLVKRHKPEGVWLSFTKAYLPSLEEALGQESRALIEKRVARDFVKLPKEKVLAHFMEG